MATTQPVTLTHEQVTEDLLSSRLSIGVIAVALFATMRLIEDLKPSVDGMMEDILNDEPEDDGTPSYQYLHREWRGYEVLVLAALLPPAYRTPEFVSAVIETALSFVARDALEDRLIAAKRAREPQPPPTPSVPESPAMAAARRFLARRGAAPPSEPARSGDEVFRAEHVEESTQFLDLDMPYEERQRLIRDVRQRLQPGLR